MLLNAANKILFAIIGIFIARKLGPGDFGTFSALAMIFSVSDILRDAGLGATFIADRKATAQDERDYMLLSVVSGFILGDLVLIFRHKIAAFFPTFVGFDYGLIFVAIALMVNGFGTIPVAKLQKDGRFKRAGAIDVGATAVSYAIAVPLIWLGVGFVALVYQLLMRVGFYVLFSWLATRPDLFGGTAKGALRKFRKSLSVLGNNILFSVYTMADNLLIGKLFGNVALGCYAAAYNFAVKPLDFITWPLNRALFVAYTHHAGEKERLASVFAKSVTAVSLFSIPVFLFMLAFADPLFPLLYGNEYALGVPVLQLLSIYLLARSIGTLSGSVLVATGRAKVNLACALLAFLVAGGGMWSNRDTLTLISATGWITAGALAVYIVNTYVAFRILPPGRDESVHLFRAVVLSFVSASVIFGISAVALPPLWRLGLAAVLVPPLHLVLIGTVFAGKPTACLSIAGIRELTKL